MLVAACAVLAAPAAGQARSPKLPPQVQRELMSMVKDCRDAGGKPGKSPGALVVADLTGDGVADFVIDQSKFNCEGNASLFSGTAGSGVMIYTGTAKGPAIKVFDGMVYEVKVDRSASPAIVKLAVAGKACGQRGAKSHAEEEACWRPLAWNAPKKKMEFAPLSRIEPFK